MDESYRLEKEAFVSDTIGSSIGHINAICLTAFTSIALYHALRTRLAWRIFDSFLLQVMLLVIPLLLSTTIFAAKPWVLNIALCIPTVLIALRSPVDISAPPLPSHGTTLVATKETRKYDDKKGFLPGPVQQLVALTSWRAHMMLMTSICILAVDFQVFPRMLAKCETFGTGLMDIGVGSFVFAQGLAAASSLLRNPHSIYANPINKLGASMRKVVPLFILAGARIIAVKGTAYPEHVSEYGAHWNFFLTMAITPPAQVLLHPLFGLVSPTVLGVLVTLVHQMILSYTSLGSWALTAPRTDLLTANREGLASLAGYLSLHLLGTGLGLIVLDPSPSFFRRSLSGKIVELKKRDDGRLMFELGGWTCLWWTVLGLSLAFGSGEGVSRRLANMPYVLWTTAYNVSCLTGYVALDRYFAPPAPKKHPNNRRGTSDGPLMGSEESVLVSQRGGGTSITTLAAPLLAAINKNGLALFLLANILTGAVNFSIQTIEQSDAAALGVLSAYLTAFCAVAWAYRAKRIWMF